MTDVFTAPDDGGDLKSSDFSTSMVDRLGAQWADTIDPKNSLSGMWLARQARQSNAAGTDQAVGAGGDIDVFSGQSLEDRQAAIDARVNAIPDVSQGDAKDLLKQEGLTEQDVHLGDAPTHKLPVLKMQIDEAHTRRDRAAAIERGPQGFFPDALGAVTSIGVGMIDPVNAAAFSIPVIGEARMGKIIASAGDSILARGAARFGQGAAQGAVGTAALQPADWWLHTRDGQDYTMAQAMESIVMGAGMGGAFHAVPGGVGDVLARRRGQPLAGSPQDLLLRGLMTGTHVHADQLSEEGVPLEDVPGIAPGPQPNAAPQSNEDIEGLINKVEAQLLPAEPVHPADVLADLPPAAREDAVHAAMADIISGRPTQAAEMLNIAADHDPRIAESFEAWHGSPHNFDAFDNSKIGTGEGAQSYGHGLYLAENRDVAEGYRSKLSDGTVIPRDLLAEYFKPGEIINSYGGRDKVVAFDKESGHVTVRSVDANGEPTKDLLGLRDRTHQTMPDLKELNEAFRRRGLPEYRPGALYKVRVNANHDHFLDWDKPLTEQHPHVQETLKKLGWDADSYTLPNGDLAPRIGGPKGIDVYHHLSDELKTMKKSAPDANGFYRFDEGRESASKALSEAGIPGIKYLDQGSRDAGDGTRNFVVFDDKHIEITHKNGEPVKREELVAEHRAQQAARKAPRGRAAADPATWSLFEHLASEGGLKPDPELHAIFGSERGPFVPGFGPLLRKTGMSLDDALTTAKEGGYFIDPTDPAHAPAGAVDPQMQGREATFGIRDLLDKVDEESRGRRQYRTNHLEATKYDPAQESHLVLSELEHELAASGAKVEDIDPQLLDRTVEIIKRDGETDVLAAYERAIMEDAERYDATAHERQSEAVTQHIPGWDAADAGAAPHDGATGTAERGQAGRPEQGARGTDGAQSSRPGRSNRSAPAEVAADPRWRALADTTPDYNDPEVLAESEAAARVPEPDSVQPAKSLSALERAAADAEEVWRQLEPTLTGEERALVNNVMDQLKLDAEARSRIITDGITCLAGAIG